MPGILAVFTSRRMLAVLLLGFSSGLPFLLIGKALQARLSPTGVTLAGLGYLSLLSLPYALKPLWAPLVDRYAPPPGRRRGWMLLSQVALMAALGLMAWLQPEHDLRLLLATAVAVAFLSATQDIVIDAWRAEALAEHELGAGAGVAILGYRAALLVTGGAAFVIADRIGWRGAYVAMAAAQGIGLVATLLAPEPAGTAAPRTLAEAVRKPLVEFWSRLGPRRLLATAAFIVLYRLGEFLAFNMATPFLKDEHGLHFSDAAIGYWQGGAGLIASIVGTIAGGALLARLGVLRGLLVFGVVQAASNLAYWYLAACGGGESALAAVVVIENLCYGLATAAFVAWLMTLCAPGLAATQYALLTALVSLSRDGLGAFAGGLAAALGWPGFFLAAIALSLPGLLLLPFLRPPAKDKA